MTCWLKFNRTTLRQTHQAAHTARPMLQGALDAAMHRIQSVDLTSIQWVRSSS